MSVNECAKLRLRTSAALVAFAFGLSACGGGGSGSSSGSTADTVVNTPGPIATQPAVQAATVTAQPAPQLVSPGQPVTFAVTATGTGLTYQWQRDGKDIPGATDATYKLNKGRRLTYAQERVQTMMRFASAAS